MNPIEGVWCDTKRFVRARNEQEFDKLLPLINEALLQYEQKGMNIKLWKRFWKCQDMYKNGFCYEEVLHALF